MRQLLILIVLVLLTVVAVERGVALGAPFDSRTLLTTGFILIGGYAMGELARRLRLPALLGYLAAGVVFGPELIALVLGDAELAPIGSAAIAELGLINVLAIGVIGTMGGGEIKLAELRENLTALVAICASVFVLVLPTVAGLVLGLSFIAPNLVPFLAELPVAHRIAGALLFGALAVGMSPAATLALLQEVRARGRFTSLVLGVVVLGDLVLVATFLLILALAKLLISPAGLSVASLAAQLPAIAAEFGWALALGVIVGLIFILYLRFVGREILLFSLAMVFVTAFVAARLHAETLLAFLVAGFTVQNFSRHGHALVEAFERIALPVFVIYFATQAATLDLVAVTVYLPLTLILITLRCGLFVIAIGFGARRAGIDADTRAQLQASFFSQGGVDLVLAAMVAEAIPGWGAEIQTVTMATVLAYVVGGPPLLARALDAVGESEAARERGTIELDRGRPRALDRGVRNIELARPRAENPQLLARLTELHQLLVELGARLIDARMLARARDRRTVIVDAAAAIRAAVERVELDAGQQTLIRRELDRARAELDRGAAEAGRLIDRTAMTPADAELLGELLATLDDAQDYGQSFRVARDAALFEPRGGRGVRTLRAVRRLRRRLAGPGYRVVPIGRLWRYHVALAVPVALWRTLQPVEARLWHALLEHHRQTRASLDALDDAPADAAPELLADAAAQARAREQALTEEIDRVDGEIELGVRAGLAEPWREFLAAVELAGTLERPAWRARPSTRHDTARAAAADLLERTADDRETAAGRLDALLARTHAELVAAAIRSATLELEGRFAAVLAELDADFETALQSLLAEPDTHLAPLVPPVPPNRDALARALLRMAEHVERLRRQLSGLVRTVPEALTQTLADTPERLDPGVELGPVGPEPDPHRASIRLRAWLIHTLAHDFGIARARAEDELGGGLDVLRAALLELARVIDYHRGEEPAPDGDLDARLRALLERARGQLEQLASLARQHLDETIGAAEHAGLEPLRAASWGELRRRLRRLDDGARTTKIDWLRARRGAAIDRARELARWLDDELAALLAERPSARTTAAWRRAVFGPRASLPESYQRLFTSVPAETVGLLITRPELERLRGAAERWLLERRGAILIHGDRGAGKRTLARQLGAALGSRVTPRWLRLGPELEREAELAAELASWLDISAPAPPTDLAELRELVVALGRARLDPARPSSGPPMIVVENAERLFRRTPAGLAPIRRMLELIAATREQVLWVVLVAEPAVVILDVALELRARFETSVAVPPMSAAQLAAILDARHRLSGYGLRVARSTPSLATWLRGPSLAAGLWRGRESALFERLARLSGGNVRQALRLWLAAAQADDRDLSTVIVGPLPDQACPLLADLSLVSRTLLAGLMLHGPLTRAALAELVHAGWDGGGHELDAELARLAERELVALADGPSFDRDARLVRVETRLIQPLTAELRACNLL